MGADPDATDPDGGVTPASSAADGEPALGGAAQWGLVAVVLACLVGAPVAMFLWPPTMVPYRDAYLGLSLVPGLVLGLVGAWTATR